MGIVRSFGGSILRSETVAGTVPVRRMSSPCLVTWKGTCLLMDGLAGKLDFQIDVHSLLFLEKGGIHLAPPRHVGSGRLTTSPYVVGPLVAACSIRRKKSLPRCVDVRRLKRNVNSSR
jgi:hypothetical protein